MVRAGDRVRIKATGSTGKVLLIITSVKGIVLDKPLALIRLDEPDEYSVTLTTAPEDKLETEDPAAGRIGV